ncbi:enolase C-terminal domain-like protein, partial [Mycobacterium sp. NAZ190054]|uniref:enolase C-terminal domain-like protein n=1 Tax=Mycobacterium sp. NAZ190054 TaxID=1747766 RepID=UPI0026F43F7A
MRVRFRGITTRELALIDGPAGWGEFGAFVEYRTEEAAHWLAAGVEAAYRALPEVRRTRIPINATVPAVTPGDVPEVLARFPGARTAKVKVAEPGQTLADDVARVNAVRAAVPTVRVDANGGWSVDDAVAAAQALTAEHEPVARVLPMLTVPHLDREFDYLVPAEQSDDAQPGVRVRV